MTLDQFYGLLGKVRLDPDEAKARGLDALARESHFARAVRIGPPADEDDD